MTQEQRERNLRIRRRVAILLQRAIANEPDLEQRKVIQATAAEFSAFTRWLEEASDDSG